MQPFVAQEVVRTDDSTLYSDAKRDLAQGQKLTSCNQAYVLCMQHDGNLIIYNCGHVIWVINTCKKAVVLTVL